MQIFSQIGRDSNLPQWGEFFFKWGLNAPGGKPDFCQTYHLCQIKQNYYPKLLAKFQQKLI